MWGLLPGIDIDWDAYLDSDFVSYNVYRREQRSILDDHETITPNIDSVTDRVRVFINGELLNAIQFAVAMRVEFPVATADMPQETNGIFDYRDDGNNRVTLTYIKSTSSFVFTRFIEGFSYLVTTVHPIIAGEKATLTIWGNAALMGFAINGVASPTTVVATPPNELSITYVDIQNEAGFNYSQFNTLWVMFFAKIPTQAQLTALHAYGDSTILLDSMWDFESMLPTFIWNTQSQDTAIGFLVDTWLKIAVITGQNNTHYEDKNVASSIVYEYDVTLTVNLYNDILETDPRSVPAFEHVTFRGFVIHIANEPDEEKYTIQRYAIVYGLALSEKIKDDSAEVYVKGRTKPHIQTGEMQSSTVEVTLSSEVFDEWEIWEQLKRLFTRQKVSATYCFRPGHSQDRYFVQMRPLERYDVLNQWRAGVTFQEVYFTEVVS